MLITVSVGLVALLAVAALVLDLAAIRVNRSVARSVSDAAAAAGALDLVDGDGGAACETALAYLQLNLPDGSSLTGADCSSLPASCDVSTPVASTTGLVGPWQATITFPVLDVSPMLDPSAIGATTQAVVADDGIACERIAVSVTNNYQTVFGRIVGMASHTTEVHSVAKSARPSGADIALNLLILERYDCDALTAEGSGGGIGGIITDAVLNTDTGELDPGWMAVDSDGSGPLCGADGVIDVDGVNAFVRADGPAGCDAELGTHTGAGGLLVGEGCGQIALLAPGTPGCNFPACTSSGTVAPDPTAMSRRVTRAPVDHRYNCKTGYPMPAGWEIDGCRDAPAPHIDDLAGRYGGVGTPVGFTTWSSLGHPCTVEGPPGTTIVVSGDIRVDCADFNVKRNVYFSGGDVVFDGNVTIESEGVLALNADTSAGFPFAPDQSEAVAFMRNGRMHKAGTASLLVHRTTIYFSSTSHVTMAGGVGTLLWSAPTTGSLEDLALWSESAINHQFAGQANLLLEGVFFAPWAQVLYQGNGIQQQVSAQFISRTLKSQGQGQLIVRPRFDRAVLFPETVVIELIR